MNAPHSPQQHDAPEQIDYNALDDTFGGQLIQAGFIVGYYAVADVTRHVVAARLALAAANLATVAAFNAFDEEPGNDLTSAVTREAKGPAATWAVLGGGAAAAAGVTAASARLHRAAARSLSRRGVRAPWTLMGAVVAAGYLAAKNVKPAAR